ncbi:MAG: polysaccharide deacetylase family protein [Chloroflexota bacterium]
MIPGWLRTQFAYLRHAQPVRLVAIPLVLGVAMIAPGALHLGGGTGHGARDEGVVALTFDDGLNGDATLAVAKVLEDHGGTGTFFVVGRTLEMQPEVARALVQRGHLLANHSADHETPSAFDPIHSTVAVAERQFEAAVGRCPAFYRAPHGTYTAWSWLAIRRAGLRVVNWDVEVRDWDATDPKDLARRVLAGVEPGSIVLLHDGRDGQPGRDRTVLVQALPIILDGLQARGLRPVRLDALLGTPGYLERCP